MLTQILFLQSGNESIEAWDLWDLFNVSSIPEAVTQQLPFLAWSNKDRK